MLITDLEFIKCKTEEDQDENWEFRSFLKRLDWSDKRLDGCVHEIARDVTDQIDCAACRNCCRVTQTELYEDEVARIARHLELSVDEFRTRYIGQSDYGETVIKDTPCPFLNGNLCTIQEHRPKNCREYPYLDKKDFRHRSIAFVENAADCPIVFNTLKILKKELRRRW